MRLMTTNFVTESQTTLTASNIDPSFPVSNLQNPFRSKRVRTNLGTTTLAVVIDTVTVEDIDSVVFMWPKEDGIRLSNSATIKIQANATNVWTSPAIDQTLTVNNTYVTASHYFSTAQSYRFWRIYIDDPSNPYTYVELGHLWLGAGLSVQNAQNGFKYTLNERSKVTTTDFGHVYVDQYPQTATLEFGYKYLDYSTIQILENAYRENGNFKPVMMVIDPDEAVFNKDHFSVYGLMKSSFDSSHVFYNVLNTDMAVVELS